MKKIISVILVLVLAAAMVLPTMAFTTEQLNTADALYQLGLFLGTGSSYSLDNSLTREQGITLLVRMLGAEKEAETGKYSHPFSDVSDWAKPYVAYAYTKGLTKGTSETRFSGSNALSYQMFVTMCLRALGYSDSGDNPEFEWDKSSEFASKIGLVGSKDDISIFTRGNTVTFFWSVLNFKMKNSDKTLADDLIAKGVFTAEQFEYATAVKSSGRGEKDETGEKTDAKPNDDPVVVPPTPGENTGDSGNETGEGDSGIGGGAFELPLVPFDFSGLFGEGENGEIPGIDFPIELPPIPLN